MDAAYVTVGQVVETNDELGEIGATGLSDGEHVHINLQHIATGLDGYIVEHVRDPAPFISLVPQADPAVPPIEVDALVGLHARADPVDIPEWERVEFKTLLGGKRPGVIKVLSGHPENDVAKLAAENPGCRFIVRVFQSWGERNITPAEFYDWTRSDVDRTVAALKGQGVADFDNWRDCGWLLPCSRGDQSLDLVIAPYESSDSWMLQIAASRFPSFILRWFGAVPSAEPDTIFQLSHDAHSLLCSSGFADFKWFWDGLPDAALATSTPQPAISVW